MIDLEEFETSLTGISRANLIAMLFSLCQTWERIALAGGGKIERGAVAVAVLNELTPREHE